MTQAPLGTAVSPAAQYLFGPVHSRRLGVSLGIDLLPHKTCNLNCVYCECGPTTQLTSRRAEWVPTASVLAELDAYLASGPSLDWITFSGSGEPTLHAGLGRIVAHLKDHHPRYPVAVLTNGTLLGRPDVAQDLARVDLVIPSLDAASPAEFDRVCRPEPGMDVAEVVDGLAGFRQGFRGRLVLEVFLVPGVNDGESSLRALQSAAARIDPWAVQLNTMDRPGTEPGIGKPSAESLARIRSLFSPLAVQVVRSRDAQEWTALEAQPAVESVLRVLQRRGPLSVEDLSLAVGVRVGDTAKLLRRMVGEGLIQAAGQGAEERFQRIPRPDQVP